MTGTDEREKSDLLSKVTVYSSTSPTLKPAGALSTARVDTLVITGTGKFGVVFPRSRNGSAAPADAGSCPHAAVIKVPFKV